jgi:nucleotide-binding universal stress UspA family protein
MHEYREFSMKTIMVSMDSSGTSYGALNYAKQLATCFSAKIVLLHVVDTTRYASNLSASQPNLAQQIDSAEDELEKIYTGLHYDGVRCVTIVRAGNIREVVSDLIKERNIDLLVIGTRGQRYQAGEELGSVAEMLLRSTRCPVLTVGEYVRQDACEGTHPRIVLFPTDFSEISRAALAYTEDLTRYLSGRLLLLHVDENHQSDHKNEFQQLLGRIKNSSLVGEQITHVGRPADVIVAVSLEKHADFIVMGVHGSDQDSGARNYGIVLDVIRLAKCPVFTLFTQPQSETIVAPKKEMTEAEEFRLQQQRIATHSS